MSKLSPTLFICLFFTINCFGNAEIKNLKATRTSSPPKIDGRLNDEQWKSAEIATDFIQRDPVEGNQASFRTEVKVIYDNDAIYIGAMLYDPHPDSIMRELGNRDDQLNADNFRLALDPYHAKQDAYIFCVWASGVQSDSRFYDPSFDAIWESAVSINDSGWSVEIKLPYSAIRFPNLKEQTWGIQFNRSIRRYREFEQWNLTPHGVANPINHWGVLTGISEIKEPLRLSIKPYVSSYFSNTPAYNEFGNLVYTNSLSYNAGADIKYGIDERFTIDMSLFPDFGQVQSDNKVKNLTPFEIVLDENRPLFKEGFELFSKDNIFYTRRIGKIPDGYANVIYQLNKGESIIDNPSQVKLLNAVKFSGRTNNGLGIGVFNAVTDNAYATIQDSTGNKRRILTDPLTNYNVVVLDKQLKNHNDIYIINAATLKTKDSTSADVTGIGFTIWDKASTFEIRGNTEISERFVRMTGSRHVKIDTIGHQYYLNVGKISGNFQYGASEEINTANFNKNDLGLNLYNNYKNTVAEIDYNIYKPFSVFRTTYNTLSASKIDNFTTGKQQTLQINLNSYNVLKNYTSIVIGGDLFPVTGLDYYEPRIPGRYYLTPVKQDAYLQGNTDLRKKLAFNFGMRFDNTPADKAHSYGYSIAPTVRFSDRFTLRHNLDFDHYINQVGFANLDSLGNIIFGRREINTIVNTLTFKYIFKNDMSLSLRGRHYLSNGLYSKYYTLLNDGNLVSNDVYLANNNFNSNYFNIDLIYSWQFAPGSSINVAYKNAIDREDIQGNSVYYDNLNNVVHAPQTNSISLQLVYYLDYQNLVKKKEAA